jgi:hypothetical protein
MSTVFSEVLIATIATVNTIARIEGREKMSMAIFAIFA